MFKLSDLKKKAMGFLSNYEEKDPATLAAAEQAVGGLLILDGIVGIDNPLGGRKRSGILGSFLGVLAGIAILVFGGMFFRFTGTQNMTVDTTGQITSISRHTETNDNGGQSVVCDLTIAYSANDKNYTETTPSQSSGNCKENVGNSIDIRYNPDHPSEFDTMSSIKSMNLLHKVTPYLGILVILIGGITFVIRLLSIIYGWKIFRRGRKLAKTLPNGGSLGSQISEIKKEFKQMFFKN